MFGHRYYGGRYYGGRYFGDGGGAAAPVTTEKRAGHGTRRRQRYREAAREVAAPAAIIRTISRPQPVTVAAPAPSRPAVSESRASLAAVATQAVQAMPVSVLDPADPEFRRLYWDAFMRLAQEAIDSGMLN